MEGISPHLSPGLLLVTEKGLKNERMDGHVLQRRLRCSFIDPFSPSWRCLANRAIE